jgi:Mg/Co/Ni transporter MgtE
MSPIEELVCEHKMDRICELFEQLALDAVTAALENINKRNEHFELQKRRKQNNEDYPF